VKNAIKQKIASNEEFNPKTLEKISNAAKSICQWVIAVSKFTDVWEMIDQKRK
jgi:dynein heavy chain